MGLRQLGDEFEQAGNDAAGLDGKAEQLADLAQQDADGDTIEEPDQNRLGQEIRQRAESQETRRDAKQSGEKRQHDRKRRI